LNLYIYLVTEYPVETLFVLGFIAFVVTAIALIYYFERKSVEQKAEPDESSSENKPPVLPEGICPPELAEYESDFVKLWAIKTGFERGLIDYDQYKQ